MVCHTTSLTMLLTRAPLGLDTLSCCRANGVMTAITKCSLSERNVMHPCPGGLTWSTSMTFNSGRKSPSLVVCTSN
eukprot:9552291-Heterocapsa_arctica.AAC.1